MQFRTRACINPVTEQGGSYCSGRLVEQRRCNAAACGSMIVLL